MDRRQRIIPVPFERRLAAADRRQRALPVALDRRHGRPGVSAVDQVLAQELLFVSEAAEVLTRTMLLAHWAESRASELMDDPGKAELEEPPSAE